MDVLPLSRIHKDKIIGTVQRLQDFGCIPLDQSDLFFLSRTVEILRDYLNHETDSYYFRRLDEDNGAARIAKMILENCTSLKIFAGRAINPAHQNPGLPADLSIKMQLLDQLASLVKELGKPVEKTYY